MRVPLHVHAFRKLLVQETDETKRQMLFLSLAQEEAKLKALLRELSAKCGREPAAGRLAEQLADDLARQVAPEHLLAPAIGDDVADIGHAERDDPGGPHAGCDPGG